MRYLFYFFFPIFVLFCLIIFCCFSFCSQIRLRNNYNLDVKGKGVEIWIRWFSCQGFLSSEQRSLLKLRREGKINISGITRLMRAVFTDTRQNVLFFVALVSRLDKNLRAASWSRDQILYPLTLKHVWDFHSKVIETTRSAPCHENTKRPFETPLSHQLHHTGYGFAVFKEGFLHFFFLQSFPVWGLDFCCYTNKTTPLFLIFCFILSNLALDLC